jgi:hypothetical protein
MHDPTPAEVRLLDDWVRDFRAFVHAEENYSYGTRKATEFKVMTQSGDIEIQEDRRWEELLDAIRLFSG